MTKATLMAEIGSVVKYSDMANVGSTYVVLELPKQNEQYGWWSGYKLRSTEEPYTVTTSDLRQIGWKIFNDETEKWEPVLA
jgi:hypothetical protein